MEVALYFALTTVWWMSTMSVLLPFVLLLKYSKTFSNVWFSWFFTKCLGPIFEPKVVPLRKAAFALLDEHLSHRDTSVPLKILEIGIGSGSNLQFYPENSKLVANDMNSSFESYFHTNQKKYPQVTFERTVICMAENMKDVEDSSMDVVISTYVLCSVTSVDAVLSELKRVLKPGGKFLFLEHVSFPSSHWTSTLQQLAGPLWYTYFNGCYLSRAIDKDIEKAGFSSVVCEKKYPPSLILFVRPQVCGIATK